MCYSTCYVEWFQKAALGVALSFEGVEFIHFLYSFEMLNFLNMHIPCTLSLMAFLRHSAEVWT